MKRPSRPAIIVVGLFVAWGSAACWGYYRLGAYHARPGGSGSPPDRWPSDASIPLDPTRPTLVIFIHPRCPCSGASLAELGQVATRCGGRFASHVVTFCPESPGRDWVAIEQEAEAVIPGLNRWRDRGGREAMRHGVETSGHVLLYEPSGRLVFSGGITASRGHQGDNRGLDDLISTILGERAGMSRSPVFGCPVVVPGPSSGAEVIP